MVRPIYLGVGECRCGNLDARLYHVPGSTFDRRAVCGRCLEVQGFAVPVSRTAADLEVVDGKLAWRASIDEDV